MTVGVRGYAVERDLTLWGIEPHVAKEQARNPCHFLLTTLHQKKVQGLRKQEGCPAPASAAAHQLLHASNHALSSLIHVIQRAQHRARTAVDHLVAPSPTATKYSWSSQHSWTELSLPLQSHARTATNLPAAACSKARTTSPVSSILLHPCRRRRTLRIL